MAKISPVFIQQFDAKVKQQYQEEMRLRGSTRMKVGVKGKTHNFPLIGKGLATPRTSQTDVTPMNVQYTQNPCILTDWNAPEYSDIFDQQGVNFSDTAELQKSSAMAIGRTADQIIINEAANATEEVAVGTTGFTLEKLLEAKRRLDNNGVPEGGRYVIHDPLSLETLLNLEKISSFDYNTARVLVNGKLDSFLGFKFIMIGNNRAEGALPKTGTTRTCFAWHMDAIGFAIGEDMSTKIDWVAEKTSYLINTCFIAGAKIIDPLGVIKIQVKEA
jgi:hypothetical protein